jgi:hypothetical protein
MGYLTCYDIILLEGTEDDFQKFLKDLALESDYTGLKEGYLYDAKWYDWEKDTFNVSKRHPNIYFRIDGNGEELEDNWRYYCCNGKFKYVEQTWPEVTKDDLE